MENKNILRRTFSFLVDRVLILLLFIIIVVSISPYWAPGALGTYSAILEMSPSHYYSQDLYSNDLYFTVYFIVVNFVYYLLSECWLKSSFGKYICGLIIVSKDMHKISLQVAIKRCSLLLLFIVLAVSIRFVFDTNYIITSILFFLIIDIPALIHGQSILDLVTNTYVVKKKTQKMV